MFELPTDFEWLAPWSALTNDADADALEGGQIQAELESGQTTADGLVAELRREMPANHRLAKCQLRVIGQCDADHNEFLFATDDATAPIACVHLTWRTETDSRWPHTNVYGSIAEWSAQMKRENVGLTKTTQNNTPKRGVNRCTRSPACERVSKQRLSSGLGDPGRYPT